MLFEILVRTPAWVYGLFAVLVAFGIMQSRTSKVGVARAALLPAAMLLWSAHGALSVFGATPAVATAWFAGLASAVMIGQTVLTWPNGLARDTSSNTIIVPGSWVPLALMMAIFFTKFAVNVELIMSPALKTAPSFWVPVCIAYGLFGGLFLSRGMTILRVPA